MGPQATGVCGLQKACEVLVTWQAKRERCRTRRETERQADISWDDSEFILLQKKMKQSLSPADSRVFASEVSLYPQIGSMSQHDSNASYGPISVSTQMAFLSLSVRGERKIENPMAVVWLVSFFFRMWSGKIEKWLFTQKCIRRHVHRVLNS